MAEPWPVLLQTPAAKYKDKIQIRARAGIYHLRHC